MTPDTDKPLSPFRRFQELPYEIRSKIWRFAVKPRVVRLPGVHALPDPSTWEHYLRGTTHSECNDYPYLLDVNREARTELMKYKYSHLRGFSNFRENDLWCEDDVLYIDTLTAVDLARYTEERLKQIRYIAIYDDAVILISHSPSVRFVILATLFTRCPQAKISLCLLDSPLQDPPEWYTPSDIEGGENLKVKLRELLAGYWRLNFKSFCTLKEPKELREEERRWREDVKLVFLTDLREEAILAGVHRPPGVSAMRARREGIASAFKNAVLWKDPCTRISVKASVYHLDVLN